VIPLLDFLKPWLGFYSLVGEASATLIGLLFVAASVGSGVYTPEKHRALRAFLSPTVVHFSSVLAVCLIAMVPTQSWFLDGILVIGTGLFGLIYAVVVLRSMVQHGLIVTVDREDRIWYAALPIVSYLIVEAAGVALLFRMNLGCELLAMGLCCLLLVGVRNAWDMTLWTVMRRRG
jgi:hypothetical protein